MNLKNNKLSSPTDVYISSEIFERNITVNWLKVMSQTVAGYIIQFRISADASGWGAWSSLADVPSVYDEYSFEPNVARGHYIQFRVKAKSLLGEEFNSDYKDSQIARKNTLPMPVKNFFAQKLLIDNEEKILLEWEVSSDIDDAVSLYEIEISINNKFWQSLDSTPLTRYVFNPNSLGVYQTLKFRVCAVDRLSAKSRYTESALVNLGNNVKVFVCKNGEYKEAQILCCQNKEYKAVQALVCKNKSYERGGF